MSRVPRRSLALVALGSLRLRPHRRPPLRWAALLALCPLRPQDRKDPRATLTPILRILTRPTATDPLLVLLATLLALALNRSLKDRPLLQEALHKASHQALLKQRQHKHHRQVLPAPTLPLALPAGLLMVPLPE